MTTYDAIVIGTGGIGSAALYQVARRGERVLGLDQFPPGHDRGSSHGQTRVIRKAYFEHPDYVPLLETAYQLWEELEQATGEQLFFPVGLLQCGPADGSVLAGVMESSRRHSLAVEQLSRREAEARWPGFQLADDMAAVFEAGAGYLKVEACVLAHLAEAKRRGAELRTGETVIDWQAGSNTITVRTESNTYETRRLVIAAGAWAGQILARLDSSLVVQKKMLFWYAADADAYSVDRGCPVYLFERPDGIFYGFPSIDARGIKVAEHDAIQTPETLVDHPTYVDRSVNSAEQRRVEGFLADHLPLATRQRTDSSVCMYTTSPDEHFVVDHHPDDPRVVFAAGMSGHGFKFAPVLGKALAEMAIDGKTDLPVGFLGGKRL